MHNIRFVIAISVIMVSGARQEVLASEGPCDAYAAGGTHYVAAHSTIILGIDVHSGGAS